MRPTRLSPLQVSSVSSGAKRADLPVQQPTKFELVINQKNREADRRNNSAERAGESGQSHKITFWIFDFRFWNEARDNKPMKRFFSQSFSENPKSAIQNRKSVGIVALVFALATCGDVAQAQQPKKVPRIAYLSGGDAARSLSEN